MDSIRSFLWKIVLLWNLVNTRVLPLSILPPANYSHGWKLLHASEVKKIMKQQCNIFKQSAAYSLSLSPIERILDLRVCKLIIMFFYALEKHTFRLRRDLQVEREHDSLPLNMFDLITFNFCVEIRRLRITSVPMGIKMLWKHSKRRPTCPER